jgi:hypothetical protein
MTTIVKVSDASTRAEIAAALAKALVQARRKPKVVGCEKLPTAWDVAHSLIDCLLDDWQQADA